ncbi:hypothetical protein [Campylobacter sp.]|uniref:hypothetical protein n=1 Tax=Campylobacter sp. TaxID=205 RepID=UPI0025C68BE8|nr:hypothetical protein [Campylobacter sp.]
MDDAYKINHKIQSKITCEPIKISQICFTNSISHREILHEIYMYDVNFSNSPYFKISSFT